MHFLRQFRLSLSLGFCCLVVGLGLIIPEFLWAYDQRDLGRLRNFGACVECNISEADLRMTKLNGAISVLLIWQRRFFSVRISK